MNLNILKILLLAIFLSYVVSEQIDLTNLSTYATTQSDEDAYYKISSFSKKNLLIEMNANDTDIIFAANLENPPKFEDYTIITDIYDANAYFNNLKTSFIALENTYTGLNEIFAVVSTQKRPIYYTFRISYSDAPICPNQCFQNTNQGACAPGNYCNCQLLYINIDCGTEAEELFLDQKKEFTLSTNESKFYVINLQNNSIISGTGYSFYAKKNVESLFILTGLTTTSYQSYMPNIDINNFNITLADKKKNDYSEELYLGDYRNTGVPKIIIRVQNFGEEVLEGEISFEEKKITQNQKAVNIIYVFGIFSFSLCGTLTFLCLLYYVAFGILDFNF